jgi:hypothetical protein
MILLPTLYRKIQKALIITSSLKGHSGMSLKGAVLRDLFCDVRRRVLQKNVHMHAAQTTSADCIFTLRASQLFAIAYESPTVHSCISPTLRQSGANSLLYTADLCLAKLSAEFPSSCEGFIDSQRFNLQGVKSVCR